MKDIPTGTRKRHRQFGAALLAAAEASALFLPAKKKQFFVYYSNSCDLPEHEFDTQYDRIGMETSRVKFFVAISVQFCELVTKNIIVLYGGAIWSRFYLTG